MAYMLLFFVILPHHFLPFLILLYLWFVKEKQGDIYNFPKSDPGNILMCEYGFEPDKDFNMLKNERVQIEGNREVKREIIDYDITVDMAKQNGKKGQPERKTICNSLFSLPREGYGSIFPSLCSVLFQPYSEISLCSPVVRLLAPGHRQRLHLRG